jgi:hypothetical protein
MDKQPTHRRCGPSAAARTVVVGVAMAALVAVFGAGQALAATPPLDERMLERQGRIDHQAAAGQTDEQGKAGEGSRQKATEVPGRWMRPEPPMGPPPQFDGDEQPAPAPTATAPAPASSGRGLVITAAVAALLLAIGATTWRIRRRRPHPESTV